MSYYGDLRERFERASAAIREHTPEELKALLATPKEDWPVNLQDVYDWEIREYLGLDKHTRPLTAWEIFSLKEGF